MEKIFACGCHFSRDKNDWCAVHEAAPELLEALKAVRSGRVAMKLWVNKNTKCGEESYAHKLSDSALRSFITEKAIAKAEGGE